MSRGGDHYPLKIGLVCIRLYGPLEQKVGSSSPGLVLFIDDNFHGFHRLYENGLIEVGADGAAVGIKILRFVDVNGIPEVGVPHADGARKVMGAVFRFAIDL